MATLAVVAHHDPDGLLAPHVRYQLRQLRAVADRLVLVSTGLANSDADDLVDAVVRRPNRGYDFGSWKAGLDAVDGWAGFDRVILSNDSYVGPLVPAAELLARAATGAYGITTSRQAVPHVQSYFAAYDQRALGLPAFQQFWADLPMLQDRTAVIEACELGLARVLAAADVPPSSYFTATPHEERVMAARIAAHHRRPGLAQVAGAAAYLLQPWRDVTESPVLGLWDRVFDDARLPAVKVSLFARNPYRIDRGATLARLTRRFPEAFAGFGDYLARVA